MSDVFRLRCVSPRVYLLTFGTQYDAAMHFVRYQEFYESQDPRFRGAAYRLVDYMRWYSVERVGATGSFTYPDDWSGFNVPRSVFDDMYALGIPDENVYDVAMRAVYETLVQRDGAARWYLIGCVDGGSAIEHELAHGLWYTDDAYRREMQVVVDGMKTKHPRAYDAVRSVLSSEGYADHVLDDELQAYAATGMGDTLEEAMLAHMKPAAARKLRMQFKSVFKTRRNAADLPWVVVDEDEE